MLRSNRLAFLALIWLLVIVLLTSLACNLTKEDSSDTSPISGEGAPPTVFVRSEPSVGSVNQPLVVGVEAVDPTGLGVTQVVMLVNDRPGDQKPSPNPEGTTPFIVNLSWTPVRAGTYTIRIIAYRRSVASEPAVLNVTVGTNPVTLTPSSGSGSGFTPSAPTVGPCRVRVDVGTLNFRSAPDASSSDYIIGSFNLNEEPLLIARLSDNSWYQVRDTTSSQIGWISAAYGTVLGSCGTIPVALPPTTPTPVPTHTLPPAAEPPPSDLVALPISGRVSLQLDASGTVTENYSLMIQNFGGQDSGAFRVQIVLPGGQEIVRDVPNLTVGETFSLAEGGGQQTITFSSPGIHQIAVFVDFENAVNESNEGNNVTSLEINVEPAPVDEGQQEITQ